MTDPGFSHIPWWLESQAANWEPEMQLLRRSGLVRVVAEGFIVALEPVSPLGRPARRNIADGAAKRGTRS